MNKKGNTFSAILVALIIFMVGMIIVNLLEPRIDSTRTDLDCASASDITDGTKLLCLSIDVVVIYFIILVFSIAGGVLADRLLL